MQLRLCEDLSQLPEECLCASGHSIGPHNTMQYIYVYWIIQLHIDVEYTSVCVHIAPNVQHTYLYMYLHKNMMLTDAVSLYSIG